MASTSETAASIPAFPWWIVLVEGIFALIFGIFLITAPGATSVFLVTVLGFYFLIRGIFSIIEIFIPNTGIHWGWLLFMGILGILVGMVVLRNSLYATIFIGTVVIIFLAVYALLMGIFGLIQCFHGCRLGHWHSGGVEHHHRNLLVREPLGCYPGPTYHLRRMYDCRWHWCHLPFIPCTERFSLSHVVVCMASRCREASLLAPAGQVAHPVIKTVGCAGTMYRTSHVAIIILYPYYWRHRWIVNIQSSSSLWPSSW